MIKKLLLLIFALFLLLIACSQDKLINAEIIKIDKEGSLNLNYQIKDVAYSPRNKVIYIAEEYKDFIWIYKDFNFQNKIGGKGNDNLNFQLLSDIEVSENGNLLALDNLQRQISIFDKDGIYRSSLSLNANTNPTKFTLASDDLIYFYDRDQQEVVLWNLLTNQEFIRFGKFDITLPQAIRFIGDFLVVTNEDYQTDLYSSLGNFVANYQQATVRDKFQNTITIHNNFIFINGQAMSPLVLQNPAKGILLKENKLLVYSQDEVIIYNLKYNLK